jgi:nucleotide-binding universal stress UspA family protein
MVRQCRAPLLLMRPSDETREIRPTSDREIRRMLVALDGSQAAERALDAALELGIAASAAVILSHVMQPPVASASPYLPDTIHLTHEEIAAREAHVQEYLDGVAGGSGLAGRDVTTRIIVDVRAVLFDLDGTLIATKALYLEAYRRAVEPYVRAELTHADILALKPTSERRLHPGRGGGIGLRGMHGGLLPGVPRPARDVRGRVPRASRSSWTPCGRRGCPRGS